MPTSVSSEVFTFHKPRVDEKQEKSARENNLFDTATAVIFNSKFRNGIDENSSIPLGAFTKGIYVKDQNGDSKIDAKELAVYIDDSDVADGKDGKIKAATVKNDYLDLLCFKSGTTSELEALVLQEKACQNLKRINQVCSLPTYVAKIVLDEAVLPSVDKKIIEYVLNNEKAKKYVKEVMYKENPEETLYILGKYGYSEKDLK